MRTIKVKYQFTNENETQRRKLLFEIAKSLSNNENLTILDVKHFNEISYMVVLAEKKNAIAELN